MRKRIVVTEENYFQILQMIRDSKALAFDTETTGLRSYHGSEVFGISVTLKDHSFYFDKRNVGLTGVVLTCLHDNPDKTVAMHNAKFDLAMVSRICDMEPRSKIYCTLTMARLEHNDHMSYSLADCGSRIGFEKDDKVMEWLKEHECFTWEDIPGKQSRHKNYHFDRVPLELISQYAMQDTEVTYELAKHQLKHFDELSAIANVPPINAVKDNEMKLTLTTFTMEKHGLKIDTDYVRKAIDHQDSRMASVKESFQFLTGKEFGIGSKLMKEIFSGEQERWSYTEKGNPSFDSDTLKKFSHPAAKLILEYRDAKSKSDFFNGFIYHADAENFVHPNFNAHGTATGRFSSTEPNFQNLTADEDGGEYPIRKAIVPPSLDYVIVSADFHAMEYIMLLELAARLTGAEGELLKRVKAGADVHQATADLAKEFAGIAITRKQAKMTNFLTIYGGGNKKLSEGLDISLAEATQIRNSIFMACPEIKQLMDAVSGTADHRKYVYNWFGRRSYFPDYRFCYKALNYLIQGGCADVMKIAMNNIHDLLKDKHSKMVMTIHDELVFYIHKHEFYLVAEIEKAMVNAFPATYLGMSVSIEASLTDLDSLIPWKEFLEAREKVS